jgi:hypothetical protein
VKEKKAFKAQIKSIEEEIESLDTELSQLKFQGTTSLLHVTERAVSAYATLLLFIDWFCWDRLYFVVYLVSLTSWFEIQLMHRRFS